MSENRIRFYEFGPFRLDVGERQLWRDGEEITLTPKAFGVLLTLVRNQGHVVEKDTSMREVWADSFVEEKNLTDNISILRQTLVDDAKEPRYIKTVPRRGYRFVGNVTAVRDEEVELVIAERSQARVVIEEDHDSIPSNTTGTITDLEVRAGTRKSQSITARLWSPQRIIIAIVTLMVAVSGAILWQRHRANVKASLPPTLPAMITVPLTSFPDEEFDSALSPDGKLVAYSWKGGTKDRMNLYVQQVDAGTPLRLTSVLGKEGSPTWSPDGRYIAFGRTMIEEDKSGIFVIPALGGSERRLFASSHAWGPEWSPDGKYIACNGKKSAQEPSRITILTVDTLEERTLTNPAPGTSGDSHPAFAPDVQTLSFIRHTDEGGEIFSVPFAGGEARQLTFDRRRIDGLVWTPDGRQLLFSSNRSGSYNLWRMPAQGGEPVRVEGIGNDAHDPSISRAHNRLTYTQVIIDTNIWRVAMHPTEPNEQRRKLVASTRRDENGRFSPDGQKIAFQSKRTGSLEIWVCDSAGANQTQLTTFNGPVTSNPRWSPDGGQIAFDSRPEGHADIYLISSDGGPVHRFTAGPGDSLAPSWSHDGRWLYFGSNRSGSWQVWKMPAAGGEAVQVTQDGGYEAAEAPDGQTIYYNKYGYNTVGLFRRALAGGAEIKVLDLPQLESFGDWWVTREGIYFIHRYDSKGKQLAQCSIDFFNFATHRTEQVAPLEHDPTSNPGLNLSPDGQWLIYSIDDYRSIDIMLVENFH